MLEHVKRSKTLFWTIELLAIALLVLIVAQLRFILEPIGQFIGAVFVPRSEEHTSELQSR